MSALFKKEWLEIARTKKMLVLVIIFLFVAISSPILAKLIPTIFKNLSVQGISITIPDPTWRDAIDQFVKNISQIAMIVIVFIFAGAVAEEKNKKTLEILLTKPVSRTSLITAKFGSAFASTILIYSTTSMLFYSYTASLFGTFSLTDFILMASLILLYLLQVIAVTLLASTLTSNQIIAAGVAFFIEIIVVTILGAIDKISRFMPGYILGEYRRVANGDQSGFAASICVTVAIIIISYLLAVWIFRRQEIER